MSGDMDHMMVILAAHHHIADLRGHGSPDQWWLLRAVQEDDLETCSLDLSEVARVLSSPMRANSLAKSARSSSLLP
jgi:hypothetical protein